MRDLTEEEKSTVCNALSIAADRFDENAKEIAESGLDPAGHLRAQFERQASESRALLEVFE